MIKYYRVKQTNFMWDEGAILSNSGGGYRAIDSVFNHVDLQTEYISEHVIEDPENSEFFEQVWPISKLDKMLFGSKKQAQAAAAALYKEDK